MSGFDNGGYAWIVVCSWGHRRAALGTEGFYITGSPRGVTGTP